MKLWPLPFLRSLFPEPELCFASCWSKCDDGHPHVYGVCNLPAGHEGKRHAEWRGDQSWAEWGGDLGPLPDGPWCKHTRATDHA